jgi:peptide/nickel transport system substrate-binding protein
MDYRILGPLDVCVDGRPLELGGEKPRALLALLLLHANEAVSVDRLIEGIWGEQLPRSAHKTLQGYVYRLRKLLENGSNEVGVAANGGVLVTSAHGYLLRVADGELDLDRFRALAERGREALAGGDPGTAAMLLRDALGLWRGPALADLGYATFAQPAIAQLEELRLAALEDLVEADLALGRDRDLVGELSALIEQNPLRERLRGQLMLALYRCGRQAEALESYQQYRRALSHELGLDPSPALSGLEASILRRDPSLGLQADRQVGVKPDSGRSRIGRRVSGFVLVSSALGAIAVIALIALSPAEGRRSRLSIAADSVGAISPTGGSIVAQAPVGSSPSAMASGDAAIWVANYNAGTVARIDPATHRRAQTILAGSTPSAIAVGAGAVWVANTFSGTVSWINPAVNRVVKRIQVGNGPSGIAIGFGSVWVANSSDGTLSRINAVTGAPGKPIKLGGGATDVTTGYRAVWVSDEPDGRVMRVDPTTDQPTDPIPVGAGPTAIRAGYGSVWVTNSLDGTVSRIDPQTNVVESKITVGNGPNAVAVGDGGVWVANEFEGTVVRIDPKTDTVAQTIRVGNRPQGVSIAKGLVWVGAQPVAVSHRGGTLTALSQVPFGSIDPTCPTGSIPCYWVTAETGDGLTAFKRVGGSDGAQVVPDLAISLPTPTDAGTTYTFTLRSGIRYSNGAPVRPDDFRHVFERLFKLNPGFAGAYYEHLVGARACLARPSSCDLARGIVAKNAANTVEFHLVTPDPEFLRALALSVAVAVPSGTPDHDVGSHPVPTTGAYQIASDTPQEVKLVRNPYFHVWSNAARPDGYPDQIVWRIGASPSAEVTAVERGSADYALDPPPADRMSEVQTRYAGQLHVNPNDSTVIMWLNTRVAPFNDISVRRAINYAVDRARVARLVGMDSRVTCQFLPPYVPGYKPYCPYTVDPSANGIWRGPDLAKARALIHASRTQGARITIWTSPAFDSFVTDLTPAGRYLVTLLDRLGYRARLRTVSATDATFTPGDSRAKIQGGLFSYAPAYPAASEFLGPQYDSCQSFVPDSANNVNWAEFCDPRFDSTVRRALAADAATSPAAAGMWSGADKQFTDQAPMVALVTPSTVDFVSHRVANYEYSPVWGALLDQLWVR